MGNLRLFQHGTDAHQPHHDAETLGVGSLLLLRQFPVSCPFPVIRIGNLLVCLTQVMLEMHTAI